MIWNKHINMKHECGLITEYKGRTIILIDGRETVSVIWKPSLKFRATDKIKGDINTVEFLEYCINFSNKQYNKFINA
jgi:hypothetical protein